jgi:hypothetical protein
MEVNIGAGAPSGAMDVHFGRWRSLWSYGAFIIELWSGCYLRSPIAVKAIGAHPGRPGATEAVEVYPEAWGSHVNLFK